MWAYVQKFAFVTGIPGEAAGSGSSHVMRNPILEILNSLIQSWEPLDTAQKYLWSSLVPTSGVRNPVQNRGISIVVQKSTWENELEFWQLETSF